MRYKLEQLRKKGNIHKQQLLSAVLEAKQVAEIVAKETKSLYDRHEIDGDDLHIILNSSRKHFCLP